jgi:transposase
VLTPLLRRVEAHVFAAERLHGDDTTVPGLAKGKTDTGQLWTYVRDDRPFGGKGPPAAMFYYSRDRRGEHPQAHLADYAGILQADAFSGYNKLYEVERKPSPIVAAGCWAHARRPFFALADIAENARRKAQGKTTAVRGVALGRRSWLFAGSDRGGQRAAVAYSLITTAKMNESIHKPG